MATHRRIHEPRGGGRDAVTRRRARHLGTVAGLVLALTAGLAGVAGAQSPDRSRRPAVALELFAAFGGGFEPSRQAEAALQSSGGDTGVAIGFRPQWRSLLVLRGLESLPLVVGPED